MFTNQLLVKTLTESNEEDPTPQFNRYQEVPE